MVARKLILNTTTGWMSYEISAAGTANAFWNLRLWIEIVAETGQFSWKFEISWWVAVARGSPQTEVGRRVASYLCESRWPKADWPSLVIEIIPRDVSLNNGGTRYVQNTFAPPMFSFRTNNVDNNRIKWCHSRWWTQQSHSAHPKVNIFPSNA